MQSDTNKINAVIKSLNNSTFEAKEAFKGALLMKKAQYLKRNTDKLSLFKKGKLLLENAIAQNNVLLAEKRFLRLMIQEKTPAILNYKMNVNEDALYIQKNYHQLDSYTKTVVLKYANQSEALKNKKFN
jgi:hypothetical protein